jgi:hypothetical protein
MDNLYFITTKDRAKVIVKELGEDYITLEHYDDTCDKVTFIKPMSSFQLLILFHAGISHGHNLLAKALGVGV